MQFSKRTVLPLVSVVLLLYAPELTAQHKTPEYTYDTAYDHIVSGDILLNNQYHLYDSKRKLSSLLKQASSIEHDTAQMEFYCNTYSIVHLKKSSLTLCDSEGLVQFDMWDNALKLSVKSKNIKIGDDVAVLKQLFPHSFSVRDYMGDEGTFQYLTCIRVSFPYSQYLLFYVNKKNKITSIIIWEDDS